MSKLLKFLKVAALAGCSTGLLVALWKISKYKGIQKIVKSKRIPNVDEVKSIMETLSHHKVTRQDIRELEKAFDHSSHPNLQKKKFNFQVYSSKDENIPQNDLIHNFFVSHKSKKSKNF